MADVLIFADSVRSAELRHEVPLAVPDAFLYLERDGLRHVVVSALEIPRLAELDGLTLHPFEEFGIDELRNGSLPAGEVIPELVVRAVRELGCQQVLVPPSFPVEIADRLRQAGLELRPAR